MSAPEYVTDIYWTLVFDVTIVLQIFFITKTGQKTGKRVTWKLFKRSYRSIKNHTVSDLKPEGNAMHLSSLTLKSVESVLTPLYSLARRTASALSLDHLFECYILDLSKSVSQYIFVTSDDWEHLFWLTD